MRTKLYLILATVLVAGCVERESQDANTGSGSQAIATGLSDPLDSVATGRTTTSATGASTHTVRARLGAKSNAASYKNGDGGSISGNTFVQHRFGVAQGRIAAQFAPTSIKFSLASTPREQAYPLVNLMVRHGNDQWTTLEEKVTVENPVSKSYPIADGQPGVYIFAVAYNGTTAGPDSKARPKVIIESVELIK